MNNKPLSKLAFRFKESRVTLVKQKMKRCLSSSGNAKLTSAINRSHSYSRAFLQLMTYIFFSFTNESLNLSKQSFLIFAKVVSSSKLWSSQAFGRSTSACVRIKKKGLPKSFEILLANCSSCTVNRLQQKIRNTSYLSRPPMLLQNFLRLGCAGVPIPGRSQNMIFLF